MANLTTQIISLACQVNSFTNILDQSTSAEPAAAWSCDLQIRASFFSDAGITMLGVADLTSATLYLKDPSNLDGSPLFSQTLTEFDNTTTTANWNAGTNQQALFTLPADSLAFGGLVNGARLLHLSVVLSTTGGKTMIGCVGTLNLIDPGAFSPDSNPVNAITVAQAQALLAAGVWAAGAIVLPDGATTNIGSAQSWWQGIQPVTMGAGSGAYNANLVLLPANALTGARVAVAIDFAASANPTLNGIYDTSIAGTLLEGPLTNPNPGQASSFLFEAYFNGANWVKLNGQWLD